MIIIEGCDNSGKSTLAAKLGKDLGLEVIHSTRPDLRCGPAELLKHSRVQLRPQRAILDRVFVISEYVYGRVVRRRSLLGKFHLEALMDYYNRPFLTIYCRPANAVILDNKGRDQMDGVLSNMERIIAEYDFFMEELGRFTKGKMVKFDYKGRDYPNLLKTCADHLQDYDSQVASATYLSSHREPVL